MGGQDSSPGLSLDEMLVQGQSYYNATFGNDKLSSDYKFDIAVVEVRRKILATLSPLHIENYLLQIHTYICICIDFFLYIDLYLGVSFFSS